MPKAKGPESSRTGLCRGITVIFVCAIADKANVLQEDVFRAIELCKSGSYEMLVAEDGVFWTVNWSRRQCEDGSG